MSRYAIAAIREQNGELGIRLLDTDINVCSDFSIREIPYYINKRVVNLALDEHGKIKWKQGSVERYPIIDKMMQSVKNENNLVVISATTGENKIYKVCNYCGQTVNIKEQELISYGKKYKLSNCKIVNKGGKEFISAIEGSIEEFDIKPKIKVSSDFSVMYIHIPFLLSDCLEITDDMASTVIKDVVSIQITPKSAAMQIKKLVLPSKVRHITSELFSSMRNLEEISFLADSITIYDSAFILLKNLKKINAKSISLMGRDVCDGLTNLEEINLEGQPPINIGSKAFFNCKKFNISSILKEGVRKVEVRAFEGNQVTKDLVIPSSVNEITCNAFDNTNITNVICKSEAVVINMTTANKLFYNKKRNDKITFKTSITALIKPIEALGENIELIREKTSNEDNLIESKLKKSKLLGVDLKHDTIVKSGEDLANALISMDQSEITKQFRGIIDEAIRCIPVNSYGFNLYRTIALKLQKLEIGFYFPKSFLTSEKIRMGKQFIVIKCKKSLLFYPIDKYILQNRCQRYKSYKFMLIPVEVEAKNLKSLDISDDGEIRAVYKTGESYITKSYTEYKIIE